jgi:hypothetical protein
METLAEIRLRIVNCVYRPGLEWSNCKSAADSIEEWVTRGLRADGSETGEQIGGNPVAPADRGTSRRKYQRRMNREQQEEQTNV